MKKLTFLAVVAILFSSIIPTAFAVVGNGGVRSTVEINSSTANGPTLAVSDTYVWSVANIGDLNGDGVNDIAVGASGDDEGGTDRGAVHIHFMNTDGSIDSTVEINSSTANGPTLDDSDLYGWSIADIGDLNGDGVNDLAVGSRFDDDGGTNRGAVHIHFMNTDGSIDSSVEINSSTANGPTLTDDDRYGISIANIGDLNGDGMQDLAVGAYTDDDGGTNRGAVHIHFMNTDGTGAVLSTVEINDSTANGPTLNDSDYYGTSIANIGDLNGDGTNDLAVCAYGDDEGGSGSGTTHIHFMNTDGTGAVLSTVEINSSTTNGPTLLAGDQYGESVANIGDLNGDGVEDLAVGANGDDEGGSGRGAVHISFMNTDGSVDSTVEINDSTANGPTLSDEDHYGTSAANIGDLNGDGVQDLAVGAYGDDEGGTDRGAFHIHFMALSADLSLAMLVDNSTPRTGDTVQYDLTLTNNGPETATGIAVTNTLSSDTSYTGSSIGLGSYDGSTGVWTVNSLASGISARITIMAGVIGATAGTVITNSAEITSTASTSDSDSTPNNASTSEDDYASASSTILAPSTGGTPLIIGGGGSSSETSSEITEEESAQEVGQCANYTDVLDTDPDCEAIAYMQSIDAMTGNPDGTFAPDGYLQRDQIAKISLETFELFDDSEDYCGGENPFPDVNSSDWAYQHICRGVELGMIYGYSGGEDEGYYRPARDVGRVEFLALILRNVSDSMPDDSLSSYDDVDGGNWFSGYAKYSYDNSLFDGNTLFPAQPTTRLEVARHVYELYLLGKI
ncbi:MAG: S-layer homology domain-containing protein [Nitrospirota bacterium]